VIDVVLTSRAGKARAESSKFQAQSSRETPTKLKVQSSRKIPAAKFQIPGLHAGECWSFEIGVPNSKGQTQRNAGAFHIGA
jgi:hypothetical protein